MARKYEKIAHELREGITNGTYPPGSTLPALSELMATYEVARETVRSAVSVLANEGLVTPLSGVGTVVRDLGTVDMHSQPGDAHPAWGSTTGDDSKIATIEASYDVANHEVAQRLGIGREVVEMLKALEAEDRDALLADFLLRQPENRHAARRDERRGCLCHQGWRGQDAGRRACPHCEP